MRSDFRLTNRYVPLPHASILGHGKWRAKRGDWLVWSMDGTGSTLRCGRSIGRIEVFGTEGKEKGIYIMAATVDLSGSCIGVAWVRPEDVRVCYMQNRHRPSEMLQLLQLDFTDLGEIEKFMKHKTTDFNLGKDPR